MLRRAGALDLSVGPFFLHPAHMADAAWVLQKDRCLQDLLSVLSSSPNLPFSPTARACHLESLHLKTTRV